MQPLVAPGRVVGLDVARALALLGMMATHILPAVVGGQVTTAQALAGGRAAALFAVLAGVSIALVVDRSAARRGRSWFGAAAGLATRAVLIAVVGLLLGGLDTGIAVILTYYGVLFLLAVPFLHLGARTLALLAAGWLVVVPVLSHVLRAELPSASYDNPTFASLTDPGALLAELLLTGYYPALPWVAYLLAGMAVGRLDLTRAGTAVGLALLGAGLAATSWAASAALVARPGVAATLTRTFTGPGLQDSLDLTLDRGLYGTTPTGSWWWLAVAAPHTATPFDLAHTIGTSLLVIGSCVLVARLAAAPLAVVFGAGAMTLTAYSLHVVSRTDGLWDGHGVGTYAGQVLAVMLLGAAYRLARRSGPLERAVSVASGAARDGAARLTRPRARAGR